MLHIIYRIRKDYLGDSNLVTEFFSTQIVIMFFYQFFDYQIRARF